MTDRRDVVDSMTERTGAAAGKVTDGACDAAETAVDQTREAARAVFEEIKAARAKAAKPVG